MGIFRHKHKAWSRKQRMVKPHVSWYSRYLNTFAMIVFAVPCFLCFIYLLLFFVLNTKLGADVLSAQLSGFLRGDFKIARVSTDWRLSKLTLKDVWLLEAGKAQTLENAVVYAPKVEAAIPLTVGQGIELVRNTTLRIDAITAYSAEVKLDFSQGELNILKVVLPYPSEPEPPSEPGGFVIWLADLNTDNANVHLLFDGFHIDLYNTDVDHYSLKAGGKLQMNSPNGALLEQAPIRVKQGAVVFNPATFSFPLSDIGDASEGLIFSGGSGSAGKVGYSFHQMERHIAHILREDADWQSRVEKAPETRGNFIVPLRNTHVEQFVWDGNRFDISAMHTELGDHGKLRMENAMMNVGPTEREVFEHSSHYAHTRSGLLAEESILWAASIDLDLKTEEPILTYFFGPVLKGSQRLNLKAAMAGDLARVSGDIALDMDAFETFDVGVERAMLRAHMDGQNLGIRKFEADTALGAVLLSGNYYIMDGDFDLDLWAGQAPNAKMLQAIANSSSKLRDGMPRDSIMAWLAMGEDMPVGSDFVSRLSKGMKPMKFFDSPEMKAFGGTLSSHLKATSKNGEIAVSMPSPLTWSFDDPVAGVKHIKIASEGSDPRLVAYKDSVVSSPGGFRLETGDDVIVIKPGLRVNLANTSDIAVDMNAHIKDPGIYAEQFGIVLSNSSPVDLSVALNTESNLPSGRFMLMTQNIGYDEWNVEKIGIDMSMLNGKLQTNRFEVRTDFALLTANIRANMTKSQMMEPTTIPFDAEIHVDDIRLASLPESIQALMRPTLSNTYDGRFGSAEDILAVDGLGKAVITAKGPYDKVNTELEFEMNDIRVYGEMLSRIHLRASYDHASRVAGIQALNAWFDPLKEEERRRPDFTLNALNFDMHKKLVAFNVALRKVSPSRFYNFRVLDLPLKGTVSFDLTSQLDLDYFVDTKKAHDPTWLEGEINLNQIEYGDLQLADTQILMSRSPNFILIKGILANQLDIAGYVRTMPKLGVSLSVGFPDMDVLALLQALNIDIRDIEKQFSLNRANLKGAIGLCYNGANDINASVILDAFDADVLGNHLRLSQPAIAQIDLVNMEANLVLLEMQFRDSTLKMSGSYNLAGDLSFDVNGEIDAALIKAIPEDVLKSGVIKEASGLLGVSLLAEGNTYSYDKRTNQNVFSLKNIDLTGYIGVRDPINILTEYSDSPFEMKQGFFVLDKKSPKCQKGEWCLYTPEGQQFMFGLREEDQWLNLDVLLSRNTGKLSLTLYGMIDAMIAHMFMKDVTNAQGKIDINTEVQGKLLNSMGELDIDLEKFKVGGSIEVVEPILLEMASLSEPIELNKGGMIKIAEGKDCALGTDCIVIPKNQALSGNVMGGNFIIFADIARTGVIPGAASLSVTANNVNFRMKDELSLALSPDIRLTSDDILKFTNTRVAGDIDIAEARYRKNFDDGSSNLIKDMILSFFVESKKRVDSYSPSFLRKWPQFGKINLDVGVSAENSIAVDVKIAGASVDLELGTQLRIGGTFKEFLPTGIVSITDGAIGFRESEFEFQSGAQIAFNNSLDGKIDIVATAEINTESSAFSSVLGSTDLDRRKRISTTDSSAGTLYAITLNVGGTVFRPKWSFDSSPYLNDTNIYALILTGRTIEDFSGNDIAMESLLSPFFSSQLDTIIDADQFQFQFTEGAAQLVYVKQINKGLRIAAGVSIKGAEGNEQAVSSEYYFNDYIFTDLTGQNTADEVGRAPTFKLGLRLNLHLPIPLN